MGAYAPVYIYEWNICIIDNELKKRYLMQQEVINLIC